MGQSGALDILPVWGIWLFTIGVVLVAIEGGYQLGRYRRKRVQTEDSPPVGEMVAATLALLAFLLAFTFGLAASRFDQRRMLVVNEANAIGTTYLRASMLAEPYQSQVRRLLREYVDVRIHAVEPGKLKESVARSQELQAMLWEHATAAGRSNPNSIVVGLFIESLNQTIDLHTERLVIGTGSRIPPTIWWSLYFVTAVGTAVMGYHSGLAGSTRSLAIMALVLAFSVVIVLIADLDRPQEGSLRVSQQAMRDLRASIESPAP